MASLLQGSIDWKSVELFLAMSRVPGTHIPDSLKQATGDSSQDWPSREGLQGEMKQCHAKSSISVPGLSSFSWPVRRCLPVSMFPEGLWWRDLARPELILLNRDTTHSTRASWSSMAQTRWPSLPRSFLSCWKTCRSLSSSPVPRYLSMHCGTMAVRTCWGPCSWLASTSFLRINSSGAIGQPRWMLGGSQPSAPPTCPLWPLWVPMSQVRTFLQPPLKGVVMETFGSGNGPTNPDLLRELREAAEQGLIIVNCTHCLQGAVTSDYASGMAMAGAGIVSGFDMTSEAALAKLSYVLGQPGLTLDDRKKLLAKNLRGEMTLPMTDEHQPWLQDGILGRRVAWLLSRNGSQEADATQDVLIPSLALAAAHAGDLDTLQAFVELGRDLNLKDCSGQTPLHVAARRGHAAVVSTLLQKGVDVNARNEDGHSPLLLAVRGRHQGVIGLLRAAGACLSAQELEDIGTELCRLASRADSEGLRAWWEAGADLGQLDYYGHCALQVAEATGNADVVTLLQSLKDRPNAQPQAH
ncbi:60 kDa lysophospholipase isoform X9 [Cricetulus griseus]|uniref:asparaginase n=1 Tax=Cricetulus griseus TaxID=10029 RepID=A0A9J7G1Z7_CRIGR|nr:60 kDa lysophospholipase isoform X9 [Cricetulus griseus]